MERFLWGVYPYICITLFFVVPIIRMMYRPFGWSTRASGMFGRKVLGVAALTLHWGLFLILVGHLAGLFGGLLGVPGAIEVFYWSGLTGGILALFGSSLALVRRLTNPEVRAMSQPDDYIVHLFIITIIGLALYQVLVDRIFGVAYPAAAWFGSLWQFSPQPELMQSASVLSKLHVFLALTFFAYFPFTKLVHMWSYPINYAFRSYQSMRTQANRYRHRWEFGGRSDKSWMLLGMGSFIATFVVAGALLGQVALNPGEAGEAESSNAVSNSNELAGEALYVSQCARCHGVSGRGDGPGANSPTFATLPRDLVAGEYRFVTTKNGVASDADLRRTLVRGLDGSGMPAFDYLSDHQIDSLVQVLDHRWENRPDPGPAVEPPPRPPTTDASVAKGKKVFSQACSTCHGESGAGDGPAAAALEIPPANLGTGRLKAGRSPQALYQRIAVGIPGSGMAGFAEQLSPEEIWAVIDYLEADVLPPLVQ